MIQKPGYKKVLNLNNFLAKSLFYVLGLIVHHILMGKTFHSLRSRRFIH